MKVRYHLQGVEESKSLCGREKNRHALIVSEEIFNSSDKLKCKN